MRRGKVYAFKNSLETGIEKIPVGSQVVNLETLESFTKDSNKGLSQESTLYDAKQANILTALGSPTNIVQSEIPVVSIIGTKIYGGFPLEFQIENYREEAIYKADLNNTGVYTELTVDGTGKFRVNMPNTDSYEFKIKGHQVDRIASEARIVEVTGIQDFTVLDTTDSIGSNDGILLYEGSTLQLLGNPITQESGEKDFVQTKTSVNYTLPEINYDKEDSTNLKLVNYNKPYVSGTPVKVYNAKDGLVDGTLGTTAQEEVSVNTPNYQSKFHKHNITKETTVNNITGWTTATSLPVPLYGSQAIVTKSRVYLLGGNNGNTSTVYTAPINTDGTLGSWTTGTPLPGDLSRSQAIVTKSRVYLLGGRTTSGGYTSTVYTAPINTDGTLGSWTTATSLPLPLSDSQAIVTKSRVYLLGGNNGNTSTVYTAPINTDGTLGSWTTGTSLPAPLSDSQAIVTKSRVYLLGGFSGRYTVSTVYTAPINEDGTLGTWTTGTSLPGALSNSQAIVTKSRVYLLGGYGHNTVYTAPFADGWEIQENNYQTNNEESTVRYTASFSHTNFTLPPEKVFLGKSISVFTTMDVTEEQCTLESEQYNPTLNVIQQSYLPLKQQGRTISINVQKDNGVELSKVETVLYKQG